MLQADLGSLPSATSTTFTMLHRTNHGYDNQRNAIFEWVTQGGVTHSFVQRTFQASGRLQCEARRMNPATFGSLPSSACTLGAQGTGSNDFGPDRITRNVYDAAGQLLQVQRGYGTSLQQNYATYTYSLNGQRRTVTDANGNKAELRYDGFDRLSRWVFPSRTSPGALNEADYESYTWDAVGNRLSLRKRDGSTLQYQYDNLNRMTRKTVPERAGLAATHTRDVFYAYDLRNLQTDARFDSLAGEGVSNAYDAFGRMVSSAFTMGGVTRTLGHQYDAAGRRTRLTYPGGGAMTYGYDPGGRLTGLYEGTGTSTPRATWSYNLRGLPTARSESAGSSVGWTWDPVERLSSGSHAFTSGNGAVTTSFAYNPASQIVTRTRNNDAYASTTAYDVSRGYSVNGLNQYTAAGPATFAHDNNGNLSSDGSTTFVYDVENRLVGTSGGYTATLTYDPLGRLWQVTGGGATTRFLWDGDMLIGEYDGANAFLRRYTHGAGAGDDPLLWTEAGNVTRWLHADHQGSIVAIAGAGGGTYQINGYDSWGIPNPTNLGRFGYTGQIWLPELGMWHYKARVYSPTLGRFLQTDPVGYQGGVNLYAYVENDPINHTDPDGQQPESVMDRRNQSFLHAMRECEGQGAQCAAAVIDGVLVVVDATFIAADILTIPSGEGLAAVAARREATQQIRSLIFGRAQRAGPGHAMRSLREARALARSGRYSSVHLNRTLRRATDGSVDSSLRPDVAAVRPDGRVDIREVASPGQSPRSLEQRYREALGDRAGEIRITRPTCIGSRLPGGGVC